MLSFRGTLRAEESLFLVLKAREIPYFVWNDKQILISAVCLAAEDKVGCTSPRFYISARVIAPSEAELTRAAYFAKTPVL